MQLSDPALSNEARRVLSEQLLTVPAGSITDQTAVTAATALQLAWTAFVDVAAFFAVLLVGFAYVWKRGDLDWVRTTAERKSTIGATSLPLSQVSTKKPVPVTAS